MLSGFRETRLDKTGIGINTAQCFPDGKDPSGVVEDSGDLMTRGCVLMLRYEFMLTRAESTVGCQLTD